MAGGGAPAPQSGQTATMGAFGPSPTQTAVNPQAQGGMPMASPTQMQQAPQQAMLQQRAMSPLMQQQMMRQQMPQQMYNPYQQQMMRQNPYQQQQMMGGLQAALMQMMGRYNQPMQRQQFMPSYQNQALQYRPDLSQAQQALSRTAVTKAEAQAAAEKAALAKLGIGDGTGEDDGFLRWQRQQYEASKNQNYGGG